MKEFRTVREAKEYLVGKIVDEAKREGTPLTEIERKMLYFTETGDTLPDMKAVSAEFDRAFDQDEYENKIRGLISSLQHQSGNELETWDVGVEKLSEGDHYLLALINETEGAGEAVPSGWRRWLPRLSAPRQPLPRDGARLLIAAVVTFTILIFLMWLFPALRRS